MVASWARAAVIFVCLFSAMLGRAATPAVTPADGSVSVMRGVIDRYVADQWALLRCYSLTMSDARRERLGRFYAEQARALDAVDFAALDRAGRVDYLLLKKTIEFEVKQLEHARKQFAEVTPLLPFAQGIAGLEEGRARMEPMDAERSAKALAAIGVQVEGARKGLEGLLKARSESGSAEKVIVDRAARSIDSLRRALRVWHDFYDGYDPQFTWWMRQTYPKVDKELDDYVGALRKRSGDGEDDPVVGDPIGREALLDALAAEMIPYTPEELITLAEREFAWCEKEMRRASNDLGVGDDWHKALERVSETHVKPGEQPALIKRLAEEATKFVEDRNLVTVPPLCKEIWRMEMMTPSRQRVNPYFTGGEIISVSYPTDTMSFEDKEMSMRGNNPAFCRATVFHELIPGHHLQIFMSERFNEHRKLFRTPFLVEGWALYWEMRMWDLDFPRSAEDRVGMLFWRAHRCARIIFSLKFHLGQMTAPEAIEFLVKHVGHERRNATAEVRRSVNGSYGPLYQAAYMLGGLQLRGLQKELVASGRMSERGFHDAVLRENAIPIEMIRASLSGAELGKDTKTGWRFYGELK
ncbi:MAG: X-Pro dipeptidyl-peptidase [Phycisphaerales bacterium]|nr:X-Pro dipeptidyl-peptidase [Phycisphaerales bacterium]